MQKKTKVPGLLDLWEVRLVLSACVAMTAATCVVGNTAEHRSQARIQEAAAKALEEERLWKEQENQAAAEAARQERERAEAEAARIAAGPIVLEQDEDGGEYYRVDYSLGAEELSVGEGCLYSELLDFTQYNAYSGRRISFCYPPALYTQVEETEQGDVMADWFLTTLTDGEGSMLIAEYRTSGGQVWDPDVLCRTIWDAHGLTGEIMEQEALNDQEGNACVRVIWKGEKSGSMAKGVFYANLKGAARILTVICPSDPGDADRLYKEFYMDSVIGMCPLSGKGQKALTWDAWRDEG